MTGASRATLILIAGLSLTAAAGAQPAIEIDLFDTPNDAGGSLSLTWRADAAPAGTLYRVYLAESPEGAFHVAAETMAPGRMSDEPAPLRPRSRQRRPLRASPHGLHAGRGG